MLAVLYRVDFGSPCYGRIDTRVANLTGHVTAESRRVIDLSALYRKMGTIVLALLIDLCAVFLAAAAGYAVMLYMAAYYPSDQAPAPWSLASFVRVRTPVAQPLVFF